MFKEKPDGSFCPLVKGACMERKCAFWVHIRGKHPQTGADMDMPDCAVKWLPVLMIENAKEARHTAAAVESFRNESVKIGLAEFEQRDEMIKLAGGESR